MIINYTVRRRKNKKLRRNKARYLRMTQSWKTQKRKKNRPWIQFSLIMMKGKKGMVLQSEKQMTIKLLKIKRLNHLTKVKQSKNRLNLNMELRSTVIVKIIIRSKLISNLIALWNHIAPLTTMLKEQYLCRRLLLLDGIPEEISTIQFHHRIPSAVN